MKTPRKETIPVGHAPGNEPDFRIRCHISNDRDVEIPFSHRHHFYAIYWFHQGSGTHLIDFETYAIRPDRIFFLRPEQIHFLPDMTDVNYSTIQFIEEFMLCSVTEYRVAYKQIPAYLDLDPAASQRIAILFQQILQESTSDLNHSTQLIQSEINTLLLELERMAIPDQSLPNEPDLLKHYKELIDQQYDSVKLVRDYARQLGVSPNHLNILATNYWGKSALSAIHERILLEIKRLLLRTDLSISEIAYRLGFNELPYFSRFFKRQVGMTPHEFREQMNKMYQR